MSENIYKSLVNGGGFSLPFLLRLHSEDELINIRVINDVDSLIHDGKLYEASNFTYSPNANGESSLEIELVNHHELIDLVENNYSFKVEAIGVFYNGEVTPIQQYKHQFGEGSWDGKRLQLKLDKDDRLGMTFPALIFNSYNNRGNS